MIINFLGDSITEGWYVGENNPNFVQEVGILLNAKVNNYGIGGSRIAKQRVPSPSPCERWDKYFGERVKDMDKDADYVVVFGGTNDFGHGDANMGTIKDKTPDTFYGAMNYLIDELIKYYPRENILFVLPLYRHDEDLPKFGYLNTLHPNSKIDLEFNSLQKYRDVMKEVLDLNHIKCLDIKDEFGKPNESDLFYDGLHPNAKGHLKLAELIAKAIKE